MWEYLVLDVAAQGVETPRIENSLLNERGAEGWELVSAVVIGAYVVFYLKRPLTVVPDAVDNREVEAAKVDWVKWYGGQCPVDASSVVQIRMRDGEIDTARADHLDWGNYNSDGDIVAYRVVKP